jgi:tetratricopeptide (TPR) repeat protein
VVLFWLGWVLVTLLPSANIFAQETRFAERYVALPLVGVIGIAATLVGELWSRPQERKWAGGIVVTALAIFGLISHHRGQFFKDDLTFLTQWTRSDPFSEQAEASLAEYYNVRGRFDEALPHERRALDNVHRNKPEPLCIKRHFGLAFVLTKTGRYAEAAAQYEEILRMKPHYSGARRRLRRMRRLARRRAALPVDRSGGLSAEVQQRLRRSLSVLKGKPVWFAATRTDPRSLSLQGQLEQVFRRAGLEVKGVQQVAFRLKAGLFIFSADAPAPGYVGRLRRLLDDAGLKVARFGTGYRAYYEEMVGKNPAWRGFRLAPDQTYVLAVGALPR